MCLKVKYQKQIKEPKSRHTAEAAAAATLLLTLVPMLYDLSRITAASFKASLARSSPSVKYWLTYITKQHCHQKSIIILRLPYVNGPWFFTYLIKQACKYGSHISCNSSRLQKILTEKNQVEENNTVEQFWIQNFQKLNANTEQ